MPHYGARYEIRFRKGIGWLVHYPRLECNLIEWTHVDKGNYHEAVGVAIRHIPVERNVFMYYGELKHHIGYPDDNSPLLACRIALELKEHFVDLPIDLIDNERDGAVEISDETLALIPLMYSSNLAVPRS